MPKVSLVSHQISHEMKDLNMFFFFLKSFFILLDNLKVKKIKSMNQHNLGVKGIQRFKVFKIPYLTNRLFP